MNKRTVWDRYELVGKLQNLIQGRGQFLCLLGGKSTGKSLVFRDLMKRNSNKVILVNLRKHRSILSGLLEELNKPTIFSEGIKIVIASADDLVKKKFGVKFSLNSILSEKPMEQVPLLRYFLEELIQKGNLTTLIIDEANSALTITERTSSESIESTKEMLRLFTFLTKEEKQVYIQCIIHNAVYIFQFRLLLTGMAWHENASELIGLIK